MLHRLVAAPRSLGRRQIPRYPPAVSSQTTSHATAYAACPARIHEANLLPECSDGILTTIATTHPTYSHHAPSAQNTPRWPSTAPAQVNTPTIMPPAPAKLSRLGACYLFAFSPCSCSYGFERFSACSLFVCLEQTNSNHKISPPHTSAWMATRVHITLLASVRHGGTPMQLYPAQTALYRGTPPSSSRPALCCLTRRSQCQSTGLSPLLSGAHDPTTTQPNRCPLMASNSMCSAIAAKR